MAYSMFYYCLLCSRMCFLFVNMIIPIHQNSHWSVAVVEFDNRELQFYDSLKGRTENIGIYIIYNQE